MKLLEQHIKINLVSLLCILLIVICVIVIVLVIYSLGEKECLRNPVDYANENHKNYWWDTVTPIRIGQIG